MTLWMVRSASGGRLADEFVDKGLVAMGSARIGAGDTVRNCGLASRLDGVLPGVRAVSRRKRRSQSSEKRANK